MLADESFSFTMDLQDGFRFLVDFEQEGIPDLLMDEPEPLGDGTGPDAATAPAAAIGNCLSASALYRQWRARIEIHGMPHDRLSATLGVQRRRPNARERHSGPDRASRRGVRAVADATLPGAVRGLLRRHPERARRHRRRGRRRADSRRAGDMSSTHAAPEARDAEAAFLRRHPDYEATAALDELRRTRLRAPRPRRPRVPRLHRRRAVRRLAAARAHASCCASSVFGNPHSVNPTSAASTELVERARARVLEFFGASPDEYEAIFTPNATGALRLVGEAYPFRPGDRFLLTFDNHNSVNGIREFARARGAETTYVPSVAPDLRVDEQPAAALPDRHRRASTTTCSPTRRSRTSPASSTRSSGSSRPTRTAGTCCSTPPRSSPPTGSTSAAGIRTSSRSPSTRCSAGRPASAACSPAARRSPSSSARGSPAARSSPRSSSASTTSPRPARRTSRTAPSTT